jgi:hypothetical protein
MNSQVIIDHVAEGWRRWGRNAGFEFIYRGVLMPDRVKLCSEPTFHEDNGLLFIETDHGRRVLIPSEVVLIDSIDTKAEHPEDEKGGHYA